MNQPPWPSVAHQLTEAKAAPSSALEKLIQDNQDFHLLRQEEANDKSGLPLWLRVYWRKNHPEGVYSANDPTGGYPLALTSVYEWMLTHQDLRRASSPVPKPPTTEPELSKEPEPPTPLDIAPPISVGSNLRISGAQAAPRSESDIRVNYQDVNKIIAASNDIEGSGHQAQFYSSNGGASWDQTSLSLVLNDDHHSDPAVDWTSDGTAWALTLGVDQARTNLQMRSYRSADGGATWTFDATISGDQTAADKEMMWVDHSPTSPFRDNIYVIWHNHQPVFVNRRTWPAGAWQTPIRVSGDETTGTGIGSDIKTNSAGDVFAFWPDTGSQKLLVAKSTDGGVTFAQPVTIAKTFGSFTISVPSFARRNALIYTSGGAYRTAAKNLVYAVWMDLNGADGCSAPGNAPGSNVASTCKTRIWFSRSTDGGGTWEAPWMINDQASLNDQFHPRLVVDETNGKLLVVYYDTVGDPGRLKTEVWAQSSADDGVAWSDPVRVTIAESDRTGGGANLGNQFGDYIGLSGHAGTFFPSFTDRRSGAREEIWTACITA